MGKSPPPYPPEVRREAIRLGQSGGRSRRQVARDFGISTQTLRQWLKQAAIDAGVRHDGLTTEETEEVRRLRREITLLREEREILLKAAACFAKETDSRRERCSSSWSARRPTIPSPGYAGCWGSPPAATTPGVREPSRRAREDVVLTAAIVRIYQESRRIYGAPRIHADLAEGGVRCGRKRVARLLRAAGIEGCHRRRAPQTTQRDTGVEPAADRVGRQFVAAAPDRLWTADITYVPTWNGFLSLAVVLDVYRRRIVGWAGEAGPTISGPSWCCRPERWHWGTVGRPRG